MGKDEEYYSYELDKPMLGKIMKDTVGIRPSWLWRIRRYAGAGGMDLKKIRLDNLTYERKLMRKFRLSES